VFSPLTHSTSFWTLLASRLAAAIFSPASTGEDKFRRYQRAKFLASEVHGGREHSGIDIGDGIWGAGKPDAIDAAEMREGHAAEENRLVTQQPVPVGVADGIASNKLIEVKIIEGSNRIR
jgi:hypothetical protein